MISLPLPEQIILSRTPRPDLGVDVEKIVEQTWQAELARRPSLFNGKIFTVESLDGRQVTGRFVEYRLFVAQLLRPDLRGLLQINPLAVTGVLRAEGGIVWGRRHQDSTQYPGIWELLPSGGADDVLCTADGSPDLSRQLLRELEEETGLIEADVELAPLCFIHLPEDYEYSYVTALTTRLTLNEILSVKSALPHSEHSEIALVAPEEMEKFLAGQPSPLRELTRMILAHASSLPL